MNVCGAPLADGATCWSDTDCAGGTCILTVMATDTTSATVTCGPFAAQRRHLLRRPGLPERRLYWNSPGPADVRAAVPDGSPCASSAECAGGTCATRASGAASTCGTPLCDGV